MAPLASTGSVVAASTASTRRCGPVIMTLERIGDHLRHSHAAREISGHARTNLNHTRRIA